MPRAEEPSSNEKQFIFQALQENLRLDSRAFDEYRPIHLTFGDQYGVALVNLGNTRILAKASAEVTVPLPDRPHDGLFTIATELSPMTNPSVESNRPAQPQEVLLSRLLEKTIRRSGALDVESLCLVAGQKCWSVRVDVHAQSDDGNLVDASCLAVVAALRHFRIPESTVCGGVLTVYTPAEREPAPLGWLHSPFCVTFHFFGGPADGREAALLDATLAEERISRGCCTVGMNRHGEICQVAKLGGKAVEAAALLGCAALALDRVKALSDLVDRNLADDAKMRNRGGLMAELRADNDRETG